MICSKNIHINIPQISQKTTSVYKNALWTIPNTLFLSGDLNYEMNFKTLMKNKLILTICFREKLNWNYLTQKMSYGIFEI